MTDTLFLQSAIPDPFSIYAHKLARHPVHRDEGSRIWAVYSHATCKALLHHAAARIPPQPAVALEAMSPPTALLATQLARLANPPVHAASRQAAMQLVENMRAVDAAELLYSLLHGHAHDALDWVDVVCRKLPALFILKSFGFPQQDIDAILPQVETLTRIMPPNKTAEQIADVNTVSELVYRTVARHLTGLPGLSAAMKEDRDLHAVNLIGLLIQSYDAGRGMLSNALRQQIRFHPGGFGDDVAAYRRLVTETLRFDPPIHNTRRVLAADAEIGGVRMGQGDAVLLVLAAANRDPERFADPERFDPDRANNGDHLSFGAGMHMCAAHHLSVRLAADTLAALYARYPDVTLLQDEFAYEPLVNARLPTRMMLRLA
ncbi:MAG TPA: cytochrome P450 [Noviherbaspirillum sp.]|jgi:cytochrome P450|uniref:cytochrome P450 n=1 Tax=Noviherbaspirillum sp. TaxID=1926288 RepID=UPI002DDCDFBD|nr:cytochrome P450 [Noviherbaspirillum sp.]HEV2611487.1 cytochrome P450 [Noviherbaspirillum sp.]